MKKIRLNPEALRVDSFPTGTPRDEMGTVHGHATKPATCGVSCFGTCATNCDCTLGCPTLVFPCTDPIG
ncbi:hypothetical protein [Longimicrobium sp.]|uniref:hypothetical protein n=1 Tax=Longimicrobium sp. TaxID=2029185 RepID=UPI002BC86B27|nr:hypothetical protein [Longimicrobium sp.]HSU14940.1 hypothetical protein [Longimicrobium sp.]